MICIADNSSIHKAKKVSDWIANHDFLKLLYLPTYSPEYNPIEQVWKWMKKMLSYVDGEISSITSQIKKLCSNWRNKKLIKAINVGMGIWCNIL